jgi:hypothetical protein
MTHIVEHKSFRYTWELVRHTYLVDSESGIEIRQVEISPSHENRMVDPPYPLTPFFEIEIDQIQKNGKTVFSLRNICPVEINQKPDWNLLNSLIKTGSPRVTRRFQSQDGETETRWLYTDDFFLISLSSGDRHDLSMLLSLILGKLNMIAVSIQSGRRILSEIENQETYRTAMSTMFSDGVDGAFRDVPVYQQHGEVTSSGPAESVAVEGASTPGITTGDARQENVSCESISPENVPEESIVAESARGEYTPDESISPESAPVESTTAERVSSDSASAQNIPAGKSCRSCGAAISSTTKFCGSCGTTVSTAPPAESAPVASGLTVGADSGTVPSAKPEAKLVFDVKSVEELQDLSWLSD